MILKGLISLKFQLFIAKLALILILLMQSTFLLTGQEICSNNVDDDGDGLTDCEYYGCYTDASGLSPNSLVAPWDPNISYTYTVSGTSTTAAVLNNNYTDADGNAIPATGIYGPRSNTTLTITVCFSQPVPVSFLSFYFIDFDGPDGGATINFYGGGTATTADVALQSIGGGTGTYNPGTGVINPNYNNNSFILVGQNNNTVACVRLTIVSGTGGDLIAGGVAGLRSCCEFFPVENTYASDACLGDPFTISGTEYTNATYQWASICNGVTTDLAGETNETLTFDTLLNADLSCNYQLTVTNDEGCESKSIETAILLDPDVTPPNAQCENYTVGLDSNGNAFIIQGNVNDNSTDDCNIESFELDVTNFTCADIGNNPVNLTVTDFSGNASVCQAIVTVEDNYPPDANCQNINIEVESNGTTAITAQQIDDFSNDNCGVIASMEIDRTEFTCADIGANLVTLTVMDNYGNSSSCSAYVFVSLSCAANGGQF